VFFNLFIDLVPPTAIIQQVASPSSGPVTNILVSFSKPVWTNTVHATNFALTLNGANAITPDITFISSNQCVLSGISSFTSAPGAFQLSFNLAGVSDCAGNYGSGTLFMTWQNGSSNEGPVIVQRANVAALANKGLQLSISATDPSSYPLLFELGSGAPDGVSLSTNGVLIWTPTCAQGSSSNQITIWAVEQSEQALSNSMSFAVIVGDCVEIAVGSGVAAAGSSGAAPLNVFATAGFTNLSFTLDSAHRLANWSFNSSNSALGIVAVQGINSNQTVFTLGARNGQAVVGASLLGSLTFDVTSGSSAFVPLTVGEMASTEINNIPVGTVMAENGRVVIVGPEPLLEAQWTNQSANLLLYGLPGSSCQVQSTMDLQSPKDWVNFVTCPITNYVTVLSNVNESANTIFYRAYAVTNR
jgi:hypothetical protein